MLAIHCINKEQVSTLNVINFNYSHSLVSILILPFDLEDKPFAKRS
jgi:hypothetical protein